MTGCLYVVATPIGHLDDISPRALAILKSVDVILAEDTRHSQRLLQHYQINANLQAFHDFNEQQQTPGLIARLQQGQQLALISDAGTPLISDPGYRLIDQAHLAHIQVSPVPGPCAAITALSAAGLPTDAFHFMGFLASKPSQRRQDLASIVSYPHTVIAYEAPHRILDSVADIQHVLGNDRQIVLARELTKRFETIYRDTASNCYEWLTNDPQQQKGEFVMLIAGVGQSDEALAQQRLQRAQTIYGWLKAEMPMSKAVKLAAKIAGANKNQLYEWALDDG